MPLSSKSLRRHPAGLLLAAQLLAAGATFTLLAWGYAFVFPVCQSLVPGSFTAAANPEGARGWLERRMGQGLADAISDGEAREEQ